MDNNSNFSLFIYLFVNNTFNILLIYLRNYLFCFIYNIYLLCYFTHHSDGDMEWHERNRRDLVIHDCNKQGQNVV